ncbi:hypothetical protein K502DRAFT_340879 [Neoconidiobolus thromboides FSU 785]|nr:hypothetical protein K502DRAFT_340879 [Neoconidiobolus thromboides FSU 785]
MKFTIPLILLSSVLARTLPPTNVGEVQLHENVEASTNSNLERRRVVVVTKVVYVSAKPNNNNNKPKPNNPPTNNKPKPNNPPTNNNKPSGNGGLNERDVEMLCRVNAIRKKHGKKPLKMDDKLNRAAQKHSQDQFNHKKMTHEGTKVKSFWDRIKNEGNYWTQEFAKGTQCTCQVIPDCSKYH